MISIPVISQVYKVEVAARKQSVMIDLPGGDRTVMSHKCVDVLMTYIATGDKVYFRITGKGMCYQKPHLGKEKKIDKRECIQEFERLLPGEGAITFKRCQLAGEL